MSELFHLFVVRTFSIYTFAIRFLKVGPWSSVFRSYFCHLLCKAFAFCVLGQIFAICFVKVGPLPSVFNDQNFVIRFKVGTIAFYYIAVTLVFISASVLR